MGILWKCVSHYSHSSFFIVTNFEIWVYKENMWIKRHIVLFMVTNFEIWVHIEIMWIKRHIVLFMVTNMGIHRNYVSFIHIVPFNSYKFWNMGIQGNENSFFYLLL